MEPEIIGMLFLAFCALTAICVAFFGGVFFGNGWKEERLFENGELLVDKISLLNPYVEDAVRQYAVKQMSERYAELNLQAKGSRGLYTKAFLGDVSVVRQFVFAQCFLLVETSHNTYRFETPTDDFCEFIKLAYPWAKLGQFSEILEAYMAALKENGAID